MISSTVLPKSESRVIRILFPEHPVEHLAFSTSPALEAVLSLHVLVGPKHHALQHAWVRQMRSLDPALKRRIEAFAFLYRWHVPDVLLPSPLGPLDAFEDELARIARLEPELLLAAFGRPLYDHGGQGAAAFLDCAARDVALERAAGYGTESVSLARGLFDDPAAFAERFCAFLADYWTATFATEWRRLEEVLADAVGEAGLLLAARGIWPVLGRLPPHCRVDPDRGRLVIDVPHHHDVAISAENPLLLVPSVFVWPHLRINCDPPWPTALVYSAPSLAREAEPRIPPAELLRILRAVADDTRLRVLKLIAERPRTTQELAPLVGLSNAGLSKSLRRLAEAGLITPRRQGYYVVYSLERGSVRAASAGLGDFLELEDEHTFPSDPAQ
jgi:DNA-binding transcriptional ArsR family regulator